jgi:hypothetical protein
MDGVSMEMPRYKSHKIVHALKIKGFKWLESDDSEAQDITFIIPEDSRYKPFAITQEYWWKNSPVVGGYYVVYENGHQSFSPADAFESGYTLVNE